MAWFLNRALTTFRNEVNAAYPERDKASDGTIGDEAHQGGTSDHNQDADGSVDAWDMDVDLRSGKDAAEIERLKALFQKHPAGRYWIHNRKIAHRSNGWKRENYYGPNAHDKHVHWNSEPSQETSTRPWGVKPAATEEDDMTPEELFRADALENGYGDRATNPYITFNTFAKNVAMQTETTMKGVAELTKKVEALAKTAPGTVTVSDEQLERVLRKVIGSVDGV